MTPWALALVTLVYGLGGWRRLERFGLSAFDSELLFAGAALALLIVGNVHDRVRAREPHAPANAALMWSAGTFLLAGLMSTIAAGAERAAWAALATRIVALAFLYCLLTLRSAPARSALRALSFVARGLLVLTGLLLALGLLRLALFADASWPFVSASLHQHTGLLSRFYGVGINPFYCSVWTLACVGVVETVDPAQARWARPLGAVVCLATLSFVSMLVPLLFLDALPLRRSWRRACAVLIVVGAVFMLNVHPLRVDLGEHELTVGSLHPSYARDELGPLLMPTWTVSLGPAQLTAHATAYFYLAERALRCLADNPLWGVGPNLFASRCPVMTMDTYGNWKANKPHHQYLGVLAEEGAIGALAWLFSIAMLLRALQPSSRHTPLLIVFGLAGLAGPVLLELPLIAWLGTLLVNSSAGRKKGKPSSIAGRAVRRPIETPRQSRPNEWRETDESNGNH